MAAIPVTFDGVLYDLYERTTQRVIFMGAASITGIGIGGGPILPPPGEEKPPRPPWQVWPGPGDPDFPGGKPPGEKPPDPTVPPVKWKTIWTPNEGWVVVGIIVPGGDHVVPSATAPAQAAPPKK